MSRLDIMQPRTGSDGRTFWTKLGSAWPAKQGTGYSLTFEALPLPSINEKGLLECRVLLREPLPARDAPAPRGNPRPAADDYDDAGDVPF